MLHLSYHNSDTILFGICSYYGNFNSSSLTATQKVAQLEQSAGELLASLPDDGAVFGGGLCMSQREPSVSRRHYQ